MIHHLSPTARHTPTKSTPVLRQKDGVDSLPHPPSSLPSNALTLARTTEQAQEISPSNLPR